MARLLYKRFIIVISILLYVEVQVSYLGGDPRKHQLKSGEMRQRREGKLSNQLLMRATGAESP